MGRFQMRRCMGAILAGLGVCWNWAAFWPLLGLVQCCGAALHVGLLLLRNC